MKNIVICADGTWNKPDQVGTATNVVKIARAVNPVDRAGNPQVVYYHKGVGARGGVWDQLSGGAFGAGISSNIEEIYLFLLSNYQPGDVLYLMGFSRGAYTVRSVAGLIRNCGILKREHLTLYDDAYDLYRDRDMNSGPNSARALKFRKDYSHPDFNIHFIGVWDTVGALGVPVTPLRFWNKKHFEFHDVELSGRVNHAYQALAIDEKRKPFLPSVWKKQATSPASQVLEQAWFPGVHSNIGGGYRNTGLSDSALNWMAARAKKAGLSLTLNPPPRPNPDDTMNDSMTLFYRMAGNGTRSPGKDLPTSNECLHVSVSQRTNYNPDNLGPIKQKTGYPNNLCTP